MLINNHNKYFCSLMTIYFKANAYGFCTLIINDDYYYSFYDNTNNNSTQIMLINNKKMAF